MHIVCRASFNEYNELAVILSIIFSGTIWHLTYIFILRNLLLYGKSFGVYSNSMIALLYYFMWNLYMLMFHYIVLWNEILHILWFLIHDISCIINRSYMSFGVLVLVFGVLVFGLGTCSYKRANGVRLTVTTLRSEQHQWIILKVSWLMVKSYGVDRLLTYNVV